MAKAPTFKSLKAAAEAGYHGKSVNIEGKGLQKVAFADKQYDKKMAKLSADASKKGSVIAPPMRPASGTLIGGPAIAEMKPSSTKSQRTMATRTRNKITETKLTSDPVLARIQKTLDRKKGK
jgi:hypothetical protein